jgi:tetratricopeptide (TPR) repeat protein
MKAIFTFILTLSSVIVFGNVHYIRFEQIPNSGKHAEAINFIIEHEEYYNHWQPEWSFDVSRQSLVNTLKESYKTFSRMDKKNLEVNLLLGDIAHYLYNLHEEKYYQVAVKHYEKAIALAPGDYRPLWFAANHYALSNVPQKSIEYFLRSQKLLPAGEPAAFWEQFSFAAGVANMPTHCIFAMDKTRSILGKPGYFEEQLGTTIHNRIIPVKSDSTYHFQDIWTASVDKMVSFVCRPMGLNLLVDSTWQVSFYNYQNFQTAVVIVPPAITNAQGRDITYSIALIMRVAKKGEDLQGYVNKYVSTYPERNDFLFSTKFPGIVSEEIKDPNMYGDIGGAHMHVVGIERQRPLYPGLLLERPVSIPKSSDELAFYRASDSKDRFQGRIFYALMLDTCEDIYPQAYALFKEFFENQIVIE